MGVLYSLVLAIILIVYSFILSATLKQVLYREFDHRLEFKTQEITDLFNSFFQDANTAIATFSIASHQIILHENLSYGPPGAYNLQTKILEALDRYELRGDYVVLKDIRGEPLVASSNISPELLKEMLEKHPEAIPSQGRLSSFRFKEKSLRMIERAIHLKDGQSYLIQIASSASHLDRITNRLIVSALILLPLMLLTTSFMGRVLAQNILKPVTAVAKIAEGISHEDLSQRVEVGEIDTEMQSLVQAFNHMIARLEQSFHHISEFSSHVAHELKTPLAVIRGESEIALRKERTSEEYQEALRANLREARRMIRVVEDILLLSRIDYDPSCMQFRRLDFKSFFAEIFEQAKILGESKALKIQTQVQDKAAFIMGDEVHLRRLFLNLIDNAVKYSPPQGILELKVSSQENQLVVTVKDSGPGIPPEDLGKIFEKFFHKDLLNAPPGNGLGLSIARSIALAHQGEIQVQSSVGHGALFTVRLPLQQ